VVINNRAAFVVGPADRPDHEHSTIRYCPGWVGTAFAPSLDKGRSPHGYINQRLKYSLELLMISGMPLETCWAFNKFWNGKFCYKFACSHPDWTTAGNHMGILIRGYKYSLELLMMSGMSLETCWAFNKFWKGKFRYKIASCWLFLLIHTTMQGSMNIIFNGGREEMRKSDSSTCVSENNEMNWKRLSLKDIKVVSSGSGKDVSAYCLKHSNDSKNVQYKAGKCLNCAVDY
jgi:hypothetical protein